MGITIGQEKAEHGMVAFVAINNTLGLQGNQRERKWYREFEITTEDFFS